MHNEVRETMREALIQAGAALQKHVGQFNEPYLVLRKHGNGWQGVYEDRPSLMNIFAAAEPQIEKLDTAFLAAFGTRHPEFAGMLSFQTIGGWNIMHQPGFIVRQAMNTLWRRHGTFQPEAGAIETVIQELSDLVDRPVVRFRFMAQLLNYEMAAETIQLPKSMVIRRLSEQEVTDIHGGYLWHPGMSRQNSLSPIEFAIEGEYEEEMAFGEIRDDPETRGRVRRLLDTAVLPLRTFKEGRVGYDQVRFSTVRFCPIIMPSLGYGDVYVPRGRFSISNDEVDGLRRQADLIFACKDASMQMACARLSDAENRTRIEDKVVDAVVGMESILLAAIHKDDRRGELSFRFSMNYSTLFDAPEQKLAAYNVARDLYGLRSVVAHGAAIDEEKLKISGEKMNLDAAGKRATEVLRSIIKFFLPERQASYKNAEFWQRRYFGLPDA